jgi:hypothetical protein
MKSITLYVAWSTNDLIVGTGESREEAKSILENEYGEETAGSGKIELQLPYASDENAGPCALTDIVLESHEEEEDETEETTSEDPVASDK